MFNVSHLTHLLRKVVRRKPRERKGDVVSKAVTTLADGKEKWSWSKDPAVEAAKWPIAGPVDREYLERVRGEHWMKVVVEVAAERRLNGLYFRQWKELAIRRLMRTTVKRLAAAVNEVVGEEGSGRGSVKGRELKAAFREFLLDSRKDKGLVEPWAYREWLWTDRNTVYLAPVGRRKTVGRGRVAG